MSALTKEQLDEALALVRKGWPLAQIARLYGVQRQAFYMRAKRDPEWRAEIGKARAVAFGSFWDKMQKIAEEKGAWQAFAWILERRYGVLSPDDQLKKLAAEAAAKAAKPSDDQEKWRDMVSAIPGRHKPEPQVEDTEAGDDDGC